MSSILTTQQKQLKLQHRFHKYSNPWPRGPLRRGHQLGWGPQRGHWICGGHQEWNDGKEDAMMLMLVVVVVMTTTTPRHVARTRGSNHRWERGRRPRRRRDQWWSRGCPRRERAWREEHFGLRFCFDYSFHERKCFLQVSTWTRERVRLIMDARSAQCS